MIPSIAGLILNLDNSTLYSLYKVSLVLSTYNIFITLFFTSLGFLFSTKIKKSVVVNSVLFIVILLIFITPLLSGSLFKKDLKYDPSYFLGSLSEDLLEKKDLMLNNEQKSMFSIFTKVYSKNIDSSQVDSYFYLNEPAKVKRLPLYLNMSIFIIISILFLTIANFILSRKEIY